MYEARSQHMLDGLGDECQNYDVVSGHFVKEPIYAKFQQQQLLTIFRNPVSRIISQYSNWKDDTRVEWGSPAWQVSAVAREAIQIAQERDLEGFLSSENDEIIANTNNVLTRAFCNEATDDPREIRPSMVDSAFENLRSFFWLGLLERMHESFVMLSRQLCMPELIYGAMQIHNAGKTKHSLSVNARELLKSRTTLDRKLYRLVEEEFDRRLKIVLTESVKTSVLLQKETDLGAIQSQNGLDEKQFIAGWSFAEETPDGRRYRWSYGGIEATAIVPLSTAARCADVQLEIKLLNLGPDIVEEDVEILLDYTPASEARWGRNELGEFIFVGRYSLPKTQRLLAIVTISTPATGLTHKVYDPREQLGVAISNIKTCELSSV